MSNTEHVTAFIGYTQQGTVIGTVQPTAILGENVAVVIDGDSTAWFPYRTGRFTNERDALVGLLGIEVAGAKVPGMKYCAARAAEGSL